MKIWPWLLVGIGIFILGFVLGHLFWGTYSGIDEYKVFRDTLTLTLSFSALAAAVLGVVVYKLISQNLERRVEESIKETDVRVRESIKGETDYVLCKFFIELSDVYWKHYEVDYEMNDKLDKPQKRYLGMAITQSEWALKRTERLDEREFGRLIYLAKNNLAYHLAMRGWSDDAKRAIALARYAYDKVWNYDYKQTSYWAETYVFVLIRLGDRQQKEEGAEIIKAMIKRKDLPSEVRQYIEKKYRKLLK